LERQTTPATTATVTSGTRRIRDDLVVRSPPHRVQPPALRAVFDAAPTTQFFDRGAVVRRLIARVLADRWDWQPPPVSPR
jgi:hypothetical protein